MRKYLVVRKPTSKLRERDFQVALSSLQPTVEANRDY